MSACETLLANASAGAAPALRAVDCLTRETTTSAFSRLFGDNGGLLTALALLLTLYVAFFAITVMTGRTRLGTRMLTERMLLVGFVLTFATSWLAYQNVVWNLALGAPDEIAGLLSGNRGSASLMFADRIDMVFAAIGEVASQGAQQGGATSGTFTPDNLIWLAAVLLMLGTLGVLITSRIVLAVLLALGPLFIMAALFDGTRGLLVGWLRALALAALAPLFAVLGGSLSLELVAPVIARMRESAGIEPRAALALLLIAAVHVALMIIVMRVAAVIVGAWTLPGQARDMRAGNAPAGRPAVEPLALPAAMAASEGAGRRIGTSAGARMLAETHAPALDPRTARQSLTIHYGREGGASAQPSRPSRAMGIGSRFRSVPAGRRMR